MNTARWWREMTLALLGASMMGCPKSQAPGNDTRGTDQPQTATATSGTTVETAAAATGSASEAIPPGSGDYSAMLALATQFKQGELTYAELEKAVLARKLPPHPLGDGYLMTPVPKPPPGVPFDPRMMPEDWEGTWGEVAQVYWLGKLTREQYDKLHAAAHPACPRR